MIAARAAVIPVALAAGDEAACGQVLTPMLRLGAAVGHSQGLAPRDVEDAVRVRRLVIAQDVAVQIHGDIVLDLQPRRNGDVRRQLHHIVGAVRQGGGQRRLRGSLPHGLLGKDHRGQQAQSHTQGQQDA